MKCDVAICRNQVEREGAMCEDCSRRYNSEKYYIHVCDNCGSIAFFTRKISKETDRLQKISVCPKCIRKHSLPEFEVDD